MGLLENVKGMLGMDTGNEVQGNQTHRESIVQQAPSRRERRIEGEVHMIAARFSEQGGGGVLYDEENLDWLIIPKYPMPGKWQDRWCKLLIIFPETYPDTPPIGFYLNKKFKLAGGGHDQHLIGDAYHGAPDLVRQGWYWYCVQIPQGKWTPSADYREPDNLWTFLNLVRESLTSDY